MLKTFKEVSLESTILTHFNVNKKSLYQTQNVYNTNIYSKSEFDIKTIFSVIIILKTLLYLKTKNKLRNVLFKYSYECSN